MQRPGATGAISHAVSFRRHLETYSNFGEKTEVSVRGNVRSADSKAKVNFSCCRFFHHCDPRKDDLGSIFDLVVLVQGADVRREVHVCVAAAVIFTIYERERVCVCVCVCVRKREERERESERAREETG